jgi:hypothetical protein
MPAGKKNAAQGSNVSEQLQSGSSPDRASPDLLKHVLSVGVGVGASDPRVVTRNHHYYYVFPSLSFFSCKQKNGG